MSKRALNLIRQAKAEGSNTLDLGNTGLTELPEELFELEQLETLIISNGYWDFEKRKWIESTNKGNRNYLPGKLPEHLVRLQNLKRLYLDGDYGDKMGINDIGVLEKLTNLTTLNLRSNSLTEIGVLEKLTNLTTLDLSYNSLTEIGVLEKLTNLTTLNLRSNSLTEIGVLEKLTNLTTLYLSDNKQIKDFSVLEKLTNLTTLYLSDNKQIKDFSVLEKLTNLTTLDLSSNSLTEIGVLEKLTNLTTLDLSGNQISDLSVLQSLPNLQEVRASGNPIKKIPKALVEEYNCLPHLCAWWAETADMENTQPNHTVKLMLTGNSNTGKSTLVHALKEGKCKEDKKSTDGIQLEQWAYEEEQSVLFCIWDFGGQEIFHGTHRLFLASEAIQLILFDPATERSAEENKPMPNRLKIEEENRNLSLQYWIETVQALSPDSKMIVVQNKMDTYPEKYLPVRQLLAKFDTIEDIKYVSAWTGKGIPSLRLALHENALDLHEYGMPMPKSWVAVQQYFLDNQGSTNPERLLPYAEFERRCREDCGVLEISIPSLLTLLHHKGIIYYNEQYLKDTIIADQRWALDAIYKPLHHSSDFYDNMRKDWFGKVRVKHIFRAFEGDYQPKEKGLFLNLMRSCALCFRLPESKQQEEETEDTYYIFPEFLQQAMPDKAVKLWERRKTAIKYYRRRYDYLNYYRIQTFIANLGQKTNLEYIWRNGILIDTVEGIFIVEADYQNNDLLLSIEESAINRWLHEIIQELEQEDKVEAAAQWWSVLDDQENYSPIDLSVIRNRAVRQSEQEEIVVQEKKSLAEQLPDIIQVDLKTSAWLIDLERKGLENYLLRLIEKKNAFLEAQVPISDVAQKYALTTNLEELEKEIQVIKEQLSHLQ